MGSRDVLSGRVDEGLLDRKDLKSLSNARESISLLDSSGKSESLSTSYRSAPTSDPLPAGSREVPFGEVDNDPDGFALGSKPSLEACEGTWFIKEPSTSGPDRNMVRKLVISFNTALVCATSLCALKIFPGCV